MQVEVNIPDIIVPAYGTTPHEVATYIRRIAVLECLRKHRITTKQAGDLLALEREDIYTLMQEHDIPLYTLDDLRQDRQSSGNAQE